MKNFNKSHSKPLTHNSFRKDSRKYPQPRNVSVNKVQCITKRSSPSPPPLLPSIHTPLQIPTGPTKNRIIYSFFVQNNYPISDRNSLTVENQQFCLWYRNIQKLPSLGNRSLQIRKCRYWLNDWEGLGYPLIIYICIDGVFGFTDIEGKPTNRVAALKLTSMTQNSIDPITWNLQYEFETENIWEIPLTLTHLKLTLEDESGNNLQTPLPSPLFLEIQIHLK